MTDSERYTSAMRKLTVTICLTVAVLIGGPALAETVLYCQSELAAGFVKQNGTYRESSFQQNRYTIKFKNNYSLLLGLESDQFKCSAPYVILPNMIVCRNAPYLTATFIYNKSSQRFTFSNLGIGGYVMNATDTDVLFAGTCKRF